MQGKRFYLTIITVILAGFATSALFSLLIEDDFFAVLIATMLVAVIFLSYSLLRLIKNNDFVTAQAVLTANMVGAIITLVDRVISNL